MIVLIMYDDPRLAVFFFSSRRRHTRCSRDWSSDVCSSDLARALDGATNVFGTPRDAGDGWFAFERLYLRRRDALTSEDVATGVPRFGGAIFTDRKSVV